MFNKLKQTVLSRRTLSTLRCLGSNKSTTTLCKTFTNYNHSLVAASNFSCYTQVKCKYKSDTKTRKNKKAAEDSDDEEDDESENFEELEETGRKIVTVNVKAMRLDAVVKGGFGMSRNKVETAFYDSKIRVNGKKVTKKSGLVYEGDEIDLVQSISPNNPDMLVVSRILILKISDNNELYRIKLARDKNLTIDSKAVDDEE